MRKSVCLGLGIFLFCVVAMLFASGNMTNCSNYRVVSDDEASTIFGGGTGAKYKSGECGGGTGTCTGTCNIGDGPGTEEPESTQHIRSCTGSCGNYVTQCKSKPQ